MGTPDFAVESLKALYEAGYPIVSVVTMPDKPAGRGQKIRFSPVKEYALEKNLALFQPEKLKDPFFIQQLLDLDIDLGVVVAFRMLPEIVWNLPKHGTINLHGSLLPQYRGAAPINWAIINGEEETGYTIFRLKHEIDTGNLWAQEKMPILSSDNAGTVHDKMMVLGGQLLVKAIQRFERGEIDEQAQTEELDGKPIQHAPKIFKETCQITKQYTAEQAHNRIRGLSPYPGAWAILKNEKDESLEIKFYGSELLQGKDGEAGIVTTDNKSFIYLHLEGGIVGLTEIQPQGKRRMSSREFLAGHKLEGKWGI
jgi:methionyl-tRNA formyltransferase